MPSKYVCHGHDPLEPRVVHSLSLRRGASLSAWATEERTSHTHMFTTILRPSSRPDTFASTGAKHPRLRHEEALECSIESGSTKVLDLRVVGAQSADVPDDADTHPTCLPTHPLFAPESGRMAGISASKREDLFTLFGREVGDDADIVGLLSVRKREGKTAAARLESRQLQHGPTYQPTLAPLLQVAWSATILDDELATENTCASHCTNV